MGHPSAFLSGWHIYSGESMLHIPHVFHTVPMITFKSLLFSLIYCPFCHMMLRVLESEIGRGTREVCDVIEAERACDLPTGTWELVVIWSRSHRGFSLVLTFHWPELVSPYCTVTWCHLSARGQKVQTPLEGKNQNNSEHSNISYILSLYHSSGRGTKYYFSFINEGTEAQGGKLTKATQARTWTQAIWL